MSLFRKISYKWRNMSIQYAIVRIMVASLAFLICTCADSIMRVQLTRSTKALVKGTYSAAMTIQLGVTGPGEGRE